MIDLKRALILFFLLSGLLVCADALAAAPEFYVSLSPVKHGAVLPEDAVMVSQVGKKYYLFLPGAGDLNEARVWFDQSLAAEIDGVAVENGGRTAALVPDGTFRLRLGKKTYTVNCMQGSAIYAVFVRSASGSMKKIDATKTYKETGFLKVLRPDGSAAYDGALDHVKLRGNTSAQFNKKGYALKLSVKADLMGMGRAKKYAIISNARDHALIRNEIVFAMAQRAGLACTPGCEQADVYLNHVYNGTYVLQETVEVGKDRVDIDDLEKATEAVNDMPLSSYPRMGPLKATAGQAKYFDIPNDPEDITGGYLIEYENWLVRYKDEPSAFTTKKKKAIMLKAPEYASAAQIAYISALVQSYENAIFSPDGVDPDTGKHYTDIMDLDSLVLKYMLEEISKNCDGNQSSQYYYKPRDAVSTKLFAGPAWDYDTTFGDFARTSTRKLLDPEGLYLTTRNGSNYWWPQVYAKEDFVKGVRARWQDTYLPILRILSGLDTDETGGLLSVREYAARIEKSARMNFTLWPMRQSSENIASTGKTFAKNIDYLEDFITKRMAYLDGLWGEGNGQ